MRRYVLAAAAFIGVAAIYYISLAPEMPAPLSPTFNGDNDPTLSSATAARELSSAAGGPDSESDTPFQDHSSDSSVKDPQDITATVIDLGPDITPEDLPPPATGPVIDLGPRITPEDEPIASYDTEIVDLGPRISPDEDIYYTDTLSKNEPVVDIGAPISVEDADYYSDESAVPIDIGPPLDAGPGGPMD